MKRLLSKSPGGVLVYHDYDPVQKTTTIAVVQDCEPTIEMNKKRQLEADQHRKERREGWHTVATIPVGVQHKWLMDDGINVFDPDHRKAVHRKLHDPDWRYLRTAPGRLS